MQHNRISTDGFVVRRRNQGGATPRRGALNSGPAGLSSEFLIDPTKQRTKQSAGQAPVLARPSGGANALSANGAMSLPKPTERVDIDLTLDDEQPGKSKKTRKKRFSKKKIIKWVAIGLLIIIVSVAGYFGYKFLNTGSKIFKGNPIAALFNQAKPLKQDANGQTNVLLFGTSEDDPGHPAGDLTDSIMLVSINQKRKDGFMVSVPRDLHVQYGRACVSGYQGKINVLYGCVKDKEGEDAGANALSQKMGEIFGLDVQYSVHVNYTVLREAVDAVGGITVNIESTDPRGILDRNFDWDCPKGPQSCYNVKYPNGPANLNGKQALYLARARGDDPFGRTYGLSRSNPDRQDNQRKILIALKDKAVTAGVLTNPVAVNKLLDTLGNNLRTNFDAEEIKTIMDLAKNIKSSDITSWSLEDPEHLMATASCFAGDICPNKGDYSDIQKTALALAKGDKASLENAVVDVLNASGTAGLAQTKATELTGQNLKVGVVGNAPQSLGTKPVQLYDLSGGKKPGTLKKLEQLLGVTATQGAPAGVSSNANFVVIIGVQPQPATTQAAQ